MDIDNNLPLESFAGENAHNDVVSSDGQQVVSTVAPPAEVNHNSLSLGELNAVLGRSYKTREEALASVKETYNFVGKRREDIAREVQATTQNAQATSQLAQQIKQMETERFFDKNPDLAPFRAAYEKIGGTPQEFFNSPEFKPIFDGARGYAETQKLKSVLESNPRIAASQDKLSKAVEARNAGRPDDAALHAARAVLESLQ